MKDCGALERAFLNLFASKQGPGTQVPLLLNDLKGNQSVSRRGSRLLVDMLLAR
jgi:hypothetical protein